MISGIYSITETESNKYFYASSVITPKHNVKQILVRLLKDFQEFNAYFKEITVELPERAMSFLESTIHSNSKCRLTPDSAVG